MSDKGKGAECGARGGKWTLLAFLCGIFFIYTVDDNGEFYADDSTYARLPRMHVELFEKVADPELETSVRDALEAAFGPVEQVGSWSQSEQCHIEQYDFTYTKEV